MMSGVSLCTAVASCDAPVEGRETARPHLEACASLPLQEASERFNRGMRYLATQTSVTSLLIFLDAFERMYGSPTGEDAAALYRAATTGLPAWQQQYVGLLDPREPINEAAQADAPAQDRYLLRAAFCDRAPWPREVVDILRAEAALSGYPVNHVFMAYMWSLERGCRVGEIFPPRETMEARVAEALDDEPFGSDEGAEAAALLLFSMTQVVSEERLTPWVAEIARRQQSDGSFSMLTESGTVIPDQARWHSSLLGTWVMGECSRDSAQRPPFIVLSQ